MREIKFRAWNIKYKEMVEVDGLTPTDGGYNVLFGIGECIKNGDYDLMQFTGLHDKNGKEIYEGDIVDLAGSIGWVEWDKKQASYFLVDKENDDDQIGTDWFGDFLDKCEVIGNIYQHPNLLK